MDIDDRKRNIVGDLCRRMLQRAGMATEVVLTDSLETALPGADFVVTQIRVGKLPARYLDESIPVKYGLIGQETTGIGGMFKALRTIPVMANICAAIERLCPNAWLINFTNPSGIITDFVLNHTKVKCMGLCNVPIDMLDDVKENLGQDVDITYLGLNHLSWITSVKKNGEELIQNITRNEKQIRYELGTRIRHQMRIIPELRFFIDDSLDYIERIDELLKK